MSDKKKNSSLMENKTPLMYLISLGFFVLAILTSGIFKVLTAIAIVVIGLIYVNRTGAFGKLAVILTGVAYLLVAEFIGWLAPYLGFGALILAIAFTIIDYNNKKGFLYNMLNK